MIYVKINFFSPQSIHSVTKTWFAQSLNLVPALEATRPLRKARLDLFAAGSPSLQGEFKRNTSFLWQGERFWPEFRNINRYQLICWFQCGHDNKCGSWRLPRDRQHAGFEDQWWWFHDCGDNFFLYKDNDFVDYNNPQNCSQQHWPTNTFIKPARARRACPLRALGLLLADGAPTVGKGKTFWAVNRIFLRKQL